MSVLVLIPIAAIVICVYMIVETKNDSIVERVDDYVIDKVQDQGTKFIVRRLSTVYQFSIACPMKYPRCLNLVRTKTKKEAELFVKQAKKLNGSDYEGLKNLVLKTKAV